MRRVLICLRFNGLSDRRFNGRKIASFIGRRRGRFIGPPRWAGVAAVYLFTRGNLWTSGSPPDWGGLYLFSIISK